MTNSTFFVKYLEACHDGLDIVDFLILLDWQCSISALKCKIAFIQRRYKEATGKELLRLKGQV